MEWNRGDSQGQPASTGVSRPAAPVGAAKKDRKGLGYLRSLKIVQVALLFSVTVLIVAVVWLITLGGGTAEKSYVNKGKLQAVFLNGGQVYFGNIEDLNSKYLSMKNIYYLRVNQQVQPNQDQSAGSSDISLVKLGCELHGPQDEMVINREQIIFWENLKDDGQVAKAVADYVKQNPNGQKCEPTTNQSNTNNTTNTTNTNTGTNNTTNNTNTTTPSTNNTTNRNR